MPQRCRCAARCWQPRLIPCQSRKACNSFADHPVRAPSATPLTFRRGACTGNDNRTELARLEKHEESRSYQRNGVPSNGGDGDGGDGKDGGKGRGW